MCFGKDSSYCVIPGFDGMGALLHHCLNSYFSLLIQVCCVGHNLLVQYHATEVSFCIMINVEVTHPN